MKQNMKCTAYEASKEPFYLIQTKDDFKRYVVSLQRGEDIKLLLYNFIRKSRYLDIKVRDMNNKENPIDYVGMLPRKKLLSLLDSFKDMLFRNGFFEFMARISRTGEYIVLDDHGLLFIIYKYEF